MPRSPSRPADVSPARVRIAPSPTGFFHVGNARTALFNWLQARRTGGAFVCRVEDTDRRRFVEGAFEDMVASLEWLGLVPDESPLSGGPFGPYRQSERLERYERHAAALLASSRAYRCFCTPKRLARLRGDRSELGAQPVYDGRCRDLPPAEVERRQASGEPFVIRLKTPQCGVLTMHDVLRGDIEFDMAELEDIVLVKSDGFPTYHFAVVVDDHEMAITHVMRADEWIPSVPYQILLYEAFGWQAPVWAHLPMVLNPDGKGKLSKRKTVDESGQPLEQMTQVREFRRAGYLPEAMFNYLALLGWSYSGEDDLFTREQAVERFRLEDIKTSPAAWDTAKLDWMNGHYIRSLDTDDLAARLLPFLERGGLPADLPTVRRLAPLIRERLTTLADAVEWVDFVWRPVSPARADLIPVGLDARQTEAVLADARAALAMLSQWTAEAIEERLRELADMQGLKLKQALQPVRVATSGRLVSPPLFETLAIVGRDETLSRLLAAIDRLQSPGPPV